MKFYKRLSSLLVVFALLSVLFSTTVNAEPVSNTLKYWQALYQLSSISTGATLKAWELNLYNGFKVNDDSFSALYPTGNFTTISDISSGTYKFFKYSGAVADTDKKAIAKEGDSVSLTIEHLQFYINKTGYSTYYYADFEKNYAVDVLVRCVNNSNEMITLDSSDYNIDFVTTSDNKGTNINIEFTAPENINNITFDIYFNVSTVTGAPASVLSSYEIHTDGLYGVDLDVDKDKGLLKGIVGWVQNIYNSIGDIITKISNGFSNVVSNLTSIITELIDGFQSIVDEFAQGVSSLIDNILSLPSTIWNLFENGLKSLFVPSEEYLDSFMDRVDTALLNTYGGVYQAGGLIVDYLSRIQIMETTNTIQMPLVSLDSVGIPFSFGGYTVSVIPNGFGFIVEVVKKIISVVCTFFFINGLRKRYDEVMGVEQ